MRARYVSELSEGAGVDAAFVIRSREMRTARNGDAYLSVVLGDRSGHIPAVYFRPCASAISTPAGTVVEVRGTVTSFRGRRRIIVESLVPAASWDAEDFLATSHRDIEEMAAEFTAVVRSIGDPTLRSVLRRVFGAQELLQRFRMCPGSDRGGRSCLGGLMEHTLAVVDLCDRAARIRPELDRDLLVTAAVLHDVGMVDALDHDTTVRLNDRGRLVGHVALGLLRVHAGARATDIDESVVLRLEHAILAHHGTAGIAANGPSTAEALALRLAIQMDEEMQAFSEAVEGTATIEEAWTGAMNVFGRELYTPPVPIDRTSIAPVTTDRLSA